jgi:hypothetical protein
MMGLKKRHATRGEKISFSEGGGNKYCFRTKIETPAIFPKRSTAGDLRMLSEQQGALVTWWWRRGGLGTSKS